MIKNTFICIAMLISSGLVLTSCGSGGETAPSPEKRETPEKAEIEKQGSLGDQTYGLFEKAAKDNADKIKDLNALLKKVRLINAKSFANKAELEDFVDQIIAADSVAGIDAAQIKAEMTKDRNFPNNQPKIDPALLIFKTNTNKLFTDAADIAANVAHVPALEQILRNLAGVKNAAHATKKLRDDAIDALNIPAAGVAGITAAQIKAAMQLDDALPDAANLDPAGGLGARTYGLLEAAFRANAGAKDQLNALLAQMTPLYVAPYADKNARDNAINNGGLALVAGITLDQIKIAMQEDRPLLNAQGGLHRTTYDLFTAAVGGLPAYNDAVKAQIIALNTLLADITPLYAQAFPTKAARDAALAALPALAGGANVVGITAERIGNAMQVGNRLAVPAGLDAPNGLGPQTYGLFTAQAGNAAEMNNLNALMRRITPVYLGNYNDKAAREVALGTAVGARGAEAAVVFPVATITLAQIKDRVQQDKPFLVEQGALGNATYTLFRTAVGALPPNYDDAVKAAMTSLNALIGAITPIYTNAAITARADRQAALVALPALAAGANVSGITAATIDDAMKLDNALTEPEPLDLIPAQFGAHTYQLIRDANNDPAHAGQTAQLNVLLRRIAPIYVANHVDKAARDAALGTAVANAPAIVFPVAGIALANITAIMQTDKPLLKDRTGLENAAGALGATAALFTNGAMHVPAGNGAAMIQLNDLLDLAVAHYRRNDFADKDARDAAIDAIGALQGGASVATITAEQLKNAMQTDKPLILGQPASGLAPNIYTAITDPATRGARTPQDLNNVMRLVAEAIRDNRLPNPARELAINTAASLTGVPDAAYAQPILNAVNRAHRALNDNPGFAAGLYPVFTDAQRLNPGEVRNLDRLMNDVWGIYRKADDSGDIVYTSQTKRRMAIQGLNIPAGGVAGITANSLEQAWAAAVNIPDAVTSRANSGLSVGTYDAIYNAAISNEQRETLFSSILDVAKIRPRVKDVRDTATEAAVKDALNIAAGVALDAPQQNLVDTINAGLEAWQPTTGMTGEMVSYDLADEPRGNIPQVIYDRLVRFSFDDDISLPTNAHLNRIISVIKNDIYNLRPQPDVNAVIDRVLNRNARKVAWATEIKNALADPAAELQPLAAIPAGLHNQVWVAVEALRLTNAQQNRVVAEIDAARLQPAAAGRIARITAALRNARVNAAGTREVLTRFFDRHPWKINGMDLFDDYNANGEARKFIVKNIEADGRVKIKKIDINNGSEGFRDYFISVPEQQGISMEANDNVWFDAGAATGPSGPLLHWIGHP